MGNQNVKGSHKSKSTIDISSQLDKKSRTNWKAGVSSPPGCPTIELSSRMTKSPDDDTGVTDEVNIIWSVPEDDGGYPITGYRVEMLDIKSGKWIEITFVEGYEPKCSLANILYGIMYRFRVVALNDAGPSEPGEPSEPIVIDVPGVQIAPYFVHTLNDTMALENDTIEFRVRVLGTPKPSVQWYKDDIEIFSCERIEIKEEEEGGAVILKGARLSDSGNIKCIATNLLGKAASNAQLMIEASPRFDVPQEYNDGLIFRHEDVIRLKVPLVAKPAAKVVWFFEDEPITPGSDLEIETTDTYTSLRIQGAKRWHCGEFRVYAENENGEDVASILVTVTSPPLVPGRAVIIDISETKCTLKWEPSEDDGGADVKHYIVEYFRDICDVWLRAKTTKECQVTIDDLIPGSRYKFRIKAENCYGISDPGEESDSFDVAPGESGSREHALTLLTSSPLPPTIEPPSPGPEQPEDRRSKRLKTSRQAWESEETTDNEDILDRFLKVKQFANHQMSSYESDGMPSIADIDADNVSDPETTGSSTGHLDSHARQLRKRFSDTQQNSGESNLPPHDLETLSETEDESVSYSIKRPQPQTNSKEDLQRARQLYAELQQMSNETGVGSIEDIIDNLNASTESISSLIPPEKRQELNKFEMTLKEMIEEARMMAETPDLDPIRDSEDDGIEETEYQNRRYDRSRAAKSPSEYSYTESVVSVIEKPHMRDSPSMPGLSNGHSHEYVEDEFKETWINQTPKVSRSTENEKTLTQPKSPITTADSPAKAASQALQGLKQQLQQQHNELQRQRQSQERASSELGFYGNQQQTISGGDNRSNFGPDSRSMMQNKSLSQSNLPSIRQGKAFTDGKKSVTPLGADRYEEFISVSRNRREGSQGSFRGSMEHLQTMPGSTMADREKPLGLDGSQSSQYGSQRSLSNSSQAIGSQQHLLSSAGNSQTNLSSQNLGSQTLMAGIRSSSGNLSQRNKFEPQPKRTISGLMSKVESEVKPKQQTAAFPSKTLTTAQKDKQPFVPKQIEVTVDGGLSALQNALNNNTIDASKTKVASKMQADSTKIGGYPKNLPHWIILTGTYSAVFICILLISRSLPTPDGGKLYIHFTAFWSLLLYFISEKEVNDYYATDPLDNVVETFIKKENK